MRRMSAALCIAFLTASVSAVNLSIEDVASFYAEPGEKASHVPLITKNQEYYLVLVNAKPVALLEKGGEESFQTVEPESRAEEVLRQYIEAGFPSVVLVQEDGSFAAGVRSEQLRRLPNALRRERLFVRELEYADLQQRRDALLKKFRELRDIRLDVLEEDLAFLGRTLEDMRQARSLEASEKFSVLFDQRYGSAEEKLSLAENVSDAYVSAAAALANATEAVRFAQIRFGNESAFVQSLKKRLLHLEFDLVRLETNLALGKTVTLSDFASVAVSARSLQRESANGPRDLFWQYLFAGLGMAMAIFAAWFWWKFRPKTPKEAVSAGQRLVQRIRAFEEQAEKRQERQE